MYTMCTYWISITEETDMFFGGRKSAKRFIVNILDCTFIATKVMKFLRTVATERGSLMWRPFSRVTGWTEPGQFS